MAKVRKQAAARAPQDKFGFYNRINMNKATYEDVKGGKLPQVLLSNALINSCVPDEFRFIIDQQRESVEKMLKTRHMSKQTGFEIDFK